MVARRDYLVSKGLAKAGARGKFSREAHAELARARENGTVFDDDAETPTFKDLKPRVDDTGLVDYDSLPKEFPKLKEYPVLRDIKTMVGFTEEGAKVASGVCFKCAMHVSRCPCTKGITGSSIVARWDKASKPYGVSLTG